jgi:hypothetical protein
MTVEEWQGTEDKPTYTAHKHYDPISNRHYTNIHRDGKVIAQALICGNSPTDTGILTNVILNGNWGTNQYENTTLTEWVARFTK